MKAHQLLLIAVCTLLTTSCGNHRKPAGWRTSDDVHIAVDATLQGIMTEQLETFALLHPEATPRPVFCSEDSAIRLLLMDSVRCCVTTRRLTPDEVSVIESHKLGVRQALVAHDAFALIVNTANTDTLVTINDIRRIVSGQIARWEQLDYATRRGDLKFVFDHSGSSTVRYMRDSLLSGRELFGNLFAQGTNEAVIDMVRSNPDVIGVVGTDWLNAGGDSVITDFGRLDVKVLKVARKKEKDVMGWKPYQYRILSGDYPLVRSVYILITDPRVKSTTKTFYFFLKGQKGQTIFLNGSQLLPNLPAQIKSVKVD